MKYNIAVCLLIYLFIIATGCHSSKKEITEVVKHWIGKEIVFPEGLSMKIYGKDTVDYSLLKHKYKIHNYVDKAQSSFCP